MIEVVSIKFKNRGKCYFFSPNGLTLSMGDKVVVETSKGLELAECCRGNHEVNASAVVQPLRPVIRIANTDDLRVAEINKQREKEAFSICQAKIAEHGLDMKLVDVECSFEGNKTTFFFTSEGRVDFRELVKDLAGIFRNRIELRQIGVRDEAKMLGGIGICGRPYCCNQFLEDFQPVSTKMAKVQSLSLNPTKISGSCGRLMCCLRYEQDAYEDLVKNVPKQGAFVETKDGYGTAVQVNLLRQTVKVKLDDDSDDTLKLYKANQLAAVPGGRPKDGETPPSVLRYVPEDEEEPETPEDEWTLPEAVFASLSGAEAAPEAAEASKAEQPAPKKQSNRRRRGSKDRKPVQDSAQDAGKAEKPVKVEKREKLPEKEAPSAPKQGGKGNRRHGRGSRSAKPEAKKTAPEAQANPSGAQPKPRPSGSGKGGQKGSQKVVKVDVKPVGEAPKKAEAPPKEAPSTPDGTAHRSGGNNHRRRNYYRGKPKSKPNGEN